MRILQIAALCSALSFVTGSVPAAQGPAGAPGAHGEGGPGAPPLSLRPGDTICLLGNALAERQQHHGWLETRLQQRFPELGLAVRNLGFGADELSVHQRTQGFGKFSSEDMNARLPQRRFAVWDRYLEHCGADVVLAFFGFNESFGGEAGEAAFRRDLEGFVQHMRSLTVADGGGAPRLVLVGSIPMEAAGAPEALPLVQRNDAIRRYNGLLTEVARQLEVPVIDPYGPMLERYGRADQALTINGIHLNGAGNRALAEVLEAGLLGAGSPTSGPADDATQGLRDLVRAKNALWFQRYRATDGYNVYGGRSTLAYRGGDGERLHSNFEVLQRELDHLDVLVANRDAAIQALARGEPRVLDDSNAPPLLEVPTNLPGEGPDGLHRFLYGAENLRGMRTAPGMEIELFADERRFPELVNPVQMSWDTRGRLWVACWATYPHWRPDRPMNDGLLILEDVDGDGVAERSTVFAGDLHNPTGFEFWNGGVLVACAPDLLFLRDTDGDGRADTRERLLHGLSSADTHHAANSFVLGPDGALYFQEGTFHQTQIESVHGPLRNQGGCVWRYEPRTQRVERYVPYGFANPHGHVFDRWGQDFVTDGTGNVNYYALPFSGHLPQPDRHRSYFPFFAQRSRPAGGTEILSSPHFPARSQGNYLIANVIGFRGVFQYRVTDQGAGFAAEELDPIVESSDRNFRPVDLEMGPDGALYILDWHNPLIGHMQHHLRDPSRDARHGRVYRVTSTGRPLDTPPPIAGAPLADLMQLLRSPSDRVRYRVRIELSGRETEEVLSAARAFVEGLDAEDPELEHHLLEALWVHQQHDRVDRELLLRLLNAHDARARAAATRVVRGLRDRLPEALTWLAERARDEHPRVRLEALVATSFFGSAEATAVALETLRWPSDRFLDYALGETLRALEPHWMEELAQGGGAFAEHPEGLRRLLERVDTSALLELPPSEAVLRARLSRHELTVEARVSAAEALASLPSVAARAGAEAVSPTDLLVEALFEVDRSGMTHAAHAALGLGDALARCAERWAPRRPQLVRLAQEARSPSTRSVAYAEWMELDGSSAAAWASASERPGGLPALLGAIQRLRTEDLRAQLEGGLRPLLFADAARAQAERPGTGVSVDVFEPAPASARLESFPERGTHMGLAAQGFGLDLAEVAESPSFGLRFRGLLYVERPGTYTFETRSDDGSRLYIGERCVVDNDGAHGMASASGSIELPAGRHPIEVTFFESGGAEGLEVYWQGPGIERQSVPTAVLGRSDGYALRAAAIRAMARIPGGGAQRLEDVRRLIVEGELIEPALELLASVGEEELPSDALQGVLAACVGQLEDLPPLRRTDALALELLAAARGVAARLPRGAAAEAIERLEELGGVVLVLRTLPHQMRYDLAELWVPAGAPVSIVFRNNDVMPHNLVLTRPGGLAEVGRAAEGLTGTGHGADFVPEHAAVLWSTGLLMPGESERLTFVAPEAEGDYPYVCTYPGHWRVMNGLLHVVPRERMPEPGPLGASGGAASQGEPAAAGAVPTRAFVRDWTFEALAPHLTGDWRAQRGDGQRLFEEAGCITCHPREVGVPSGGPDLAAVQRFDGARDWLRHILDPSLEVAEAYRISVFELDRGADRIGRVLSDDGETLTLLPDLLRPTHTETLERARIVDRFESSLSPMPTGLLVTLTAEEILDLLNFLMDCAEAQAPPSNASHDD